MTPWTATCQAPLSMGFFRQEHWSRLPFPSPGDLPDPGIKSRSPALTGGFFTTELPREAPKDAADGACRVLHVASRVCGEYALVLLEGHGKDGLECA